MKEQVSVDKEEYGWDDFCKDLASLPDSPTVSVDRKYLEKLKRLDENVNASINSLQALLNSGQQVRCVYDLQEFIYFLEWLKK